jgi:hypothetical protein
LPATTQDRQVEMQSGVRVYGCTYIQALKCNSLPVLLTKYYSGDQIEKNEMGETCSTQGEERCINGFGGET